MSYAIEISNVTKTFNTVTAVKDLNLQLPEGKIYGFVGPNGAGKTTTIKMLLGLTKPTAGTITVNGIKVSSGQEKKLNVGYLPDVPGFYEWMTAQEYLAFCGKLLNMSPAEISEKTNELLRLTGLEGVNTKIKGYSRGMKQRLGLAQALIGNPSIVLLDEPASALDPIGRKEIMDLILSLKGKVTVLFSSHIIADVERVCDDILIMDAGVLKLNKSITELSTQIGDPVINLSFAEDQELIKKFISGLSEKEYVISAKHNDNGSVKVLVKDENIAGRDIPQLITEHSLVLRKFEIQSNSLESIFLKVVSK